MVDERVLMASDRLRAGGIVVFPTETFYGIAVDPTNAAAVDELFRLKRRSLGHSLPLIAGSTAQVDQVAAEGWRALPGLESLVDRFWPGPLTLILDGAVGLAPGVAAGDGSIAIRWTAHHLAAALALNFGHPLVSTSANLSGEPPIADGAAALEAFSCDDVYVLDDGPCAGGLASTILDPRAGAMAILREGAVARQAIEDACRQR